MFFAENYATDILKPPEKSARPITTAWEDATDGTANTDGTAIERADTYTRIHLGVDRKDTPIRPK